MRLTKTLGIGLLLAGIAGAQTVEERLKALEDRMTAKEESEGEAPEPGSPAAMALSKKIDVYFDAGLRAKSADGNFELKIGGRVIMHVRKFERRRENQKQDTFDFRQVKIDLQGRIWKDWTFRVEIATAGTPFAIDNCYVGFERFTFLKIHAGHMKAPFSIEETTSTRFIDLPERSIMNRLAPSYEVGFHAFGDVVEKILSYNLMVSNGNGRNGPDDNSDKDFTARVQARPFSTNESMWIKGLHIAIGSTYGIRNLGNKVLPYTFAGATTRTTFVNVGANNFKFDEQRTRFGAELAWLVGPASIKAEYIRTHDKYSRPNQGDHRTAHQAWYVSGTFYITGETKTWDRPRPDKPLFGSAGGFGAIEFVARWSRFKVKREMMDRGYYNPDTSANRVNEYSIGVNWWPTMNTRVSLSYTYETYKSHYHHKPLVLAGKRVKKMDVIMLRVQIDF